MDNKINSIFIEEFMQLLTQFELKNASNAYKIRLLIKEDMVNSIDLIDHNVDNNEAEQMRRDLYKSSKYLASIVEDISDEVQSNYDLILEDILYWEKSLIVNL